MSTLSFPKPMGVMRAEYERHGYRPLVDDEADALQYGATVVALDTLTGDLSNGRIIGFGSEHVRVQFQSGAIFTFDTDNPDTWGDAENRERKPPTTVEDDREFVLVTALPYPTAKPAATLFDALKASAEIGLLRAEVKRLTDLIQAMPSQESYDALFADLHGLHQAVAVVLEVRKAS